MGKNKQLRKRIRGQFRVVEVHHEKIARELEKQLPDMRLIRKWNKDIDRAQKLMRMLEEKLVR